MPEGQRGVGIDPLNVDGAYAGGEWIFPSVP
jgi:hypothetical protein